MTSEIKYSSTEYPSLLSAFVFLEKAKEEYNTQDSVNKKDGCEKAYRATTEAIDALLADNGYYVPIGKAIAHIKRTEYLMLLREMRNELKIVIDQYSKFKDLLHGNCFYTALDPKLFGQILEEVGPFLKLVEEFISK